MFTGRDGMKIIGFVGLPGSGKGEASQIARQLGLAVLVMGDVIRQEAALQGLEPTDSNLGCIGNALRAKDGPAAVAIRTLEKARALGKEIVIVDGLRSVDEVDFFRSHAESFHLVQVCAPQNARLKWLKARGRADDPLVDRTHPSCLGPNQRAAEALKQRESRELGWGMNEAIMAADLKLRNDGSLDDFRKSVKKLLQLLSQGQVCQ
jgi:dephospho-CoA kinase